MCTQYKYATTPISTTPCPHGWHSTWPRLRAPRAWEDSIFYKEQASTVCNNTDFNNTLCTAAHVKKIYIGFQKQKSLWRIHNHAAAAPTVTLARSPPWYHWAFWHLLLAVYSPPPTPMSKRACPGLGDLGLGLGFRVQRLDSYFSCLGFRV